MFELSAGAVTILVTVIGSFTSLIAMQIQTKNKVNESAIKAEATASTVETTAAAVSARVDDTAVAVHDVARAIRPITNGFASEMQATQRAQTAALHQILTEINGIRTDQSADRSMLMSHLRDHSRSLMNPREDDPNA